MAITYTERFDKVSENKFMFMTRQADAANAARWRGSDLGLPEEVKDLAAKAAEMAIVEGQKPEDGVRAAAEAASKVFNQSSGV